MTESAPVVYLALLLALTTTQAIPTLLAAQPGQAPANVRPPFELPPLDGLDPTVAETLQRLEASTRGDHGAADEAQGWARLAASLAQFGFPARALEAAKLARRLAPDDADWRYLEATLLTSTGAGDEAAAALRELVDDPRLGTLSRLRLAEIQLDLGDAATARQAVEEIQLDSSAPAALRAQRLAISGLAALSLGDASAAADRLEQALQLAPGASSLRYSLGLAHRQLGDLDRARSNLGLRGDGQIQLPDPLAERVGSTVTSAHQLVTRAVSASAAGEPARAYELYGRALEIDPENLSALRGRANMAVQQGRDDEARGLLRRLVTLSPGNPASHFNLGLLFAQQGQWAEAAKSLEEAVRLDPGYSEASFNLALVDLERSAAEAALGRFVEVMDDENAEPALRADAAEQALRLVMTESPTTDTTRRQQLIVRFCRALAELSPELIRSAAADPNSAQSEALWNRAVAALDLLDKTPGLTVEQWRRLAADYRTLNVPFARRGQLQELLGGR